MPRPPVTNAARGVRITFRTTPSELAEIDRLRGTVTVSDYLRSLVRRDALNRRVSAPPEG